MTNLNKIQSKRELEFSKARLKHSLVKFKQQIEHSHEKLADKHGRTSATLMMCFAVPVGVAAGLILPKSVIHSLVEKRTKKES